MFLVFPGIGTFSIRFSKVWKTITTNLGSNPLAGGRVSRYRSKLLMKILTKYLLKSLLFPLFYCVLGFFLLFIINDLFDNFNDFLDSGMRPLEMVYYYSVLLPPVTIYILPVCLLLSMLYSLSQLTRSSEITAMRAGGISIYRIVLPFVCVGLVATLFVGFVNEVVAPNAAYRAEQFLDFQRHGRTEDIYYANNIALKSGNHVWMIQRFDTRDHSMEGVELLRQRDDGSDLVKIQAEEGRWLDGRWWFLNMTMQHYDVRGDLAGAPELFFQEEMRDLPETPQTFMSEIKDPQYLSSREMLGYLRSKKAISDGARARLKVDFHSRIAAPLICLIVTLIGIPIGAHTGRQGAFAGVMLAIALFFVFYVFQLVCQGVGKEGWISAWLGGWLPVILFGVVSPFMIYRMR